MVPEGASVTNRQPCLDSKRLRFDRLKAKGLIHTSPGQRPGNQSSVQDCRLKACFILSVMPQSLSQVIVHIVFSTKDRRPWLDLAIRPQMHAYLATVCRDCGCEAYRVDGVADHVHIAARLARTVSQSELLEKIKKTSSAWIKTQGSDYA